MLLNVFFDFLMKNFSWKKVNLIVYNINQRELNFLVREYNFFNGLLIESIWVMYLICKSDKRCDIIMG